MQFTPFLTGKLSPAGAGTGEEEFLPKTTRLCADLEFIVFGVGDLHVLVVYVGDLQVCVHVLVVCVDGELHIHVLVVCVGREIHCIGSLC